MDDENKLDTKSKSEQSVSNLTAQTDDRAEGPAKDRAGSDQLNVVRSREELNDKEK